MKAGAESDALYVHPMLECIERMFEYPNRDESRFRSSRLIQDAVLRNLQTRAESSQRLSAQAKAAEPGVPWRAIARFRNSLVHDDLGVDLDIGLRVISVELPPSSMRLAVCANRTQNEGDPGRNENEAAEPEMPRRPRGGISRPRRQAWLR